MAAVGRFRQRVPVRVTQPTFAFIRMGGMYLTPLIPSRIQKIVKIIVDCSPLVTSSHVNCPHGKFCDVDPPFDD